MTAFSPAGLCQLHPPSGTHLRAAPQHPAATSSHTPQDTVDPPLRHSQNPAAMRRTLCAVAAAAALLATPAALAQTTQDQRMKLAEHAIGINSAFYEARSHPTCPHASTRIATSGSPYRTCHGGMHALAKSF